METVLILPEADQQASRLQKLGNFLYSLAAYHHLEAPDFMSEHNQA